jgi:hypothetical protein
VGEGVEEVRAVSLVAHVVGMVGDEVGLVVQVHLTDQLLVRDTQRNSEWPHLSVAWCRVAQNGSVCLPGSFRVDPILRELQHVGGSDERPGKPGQIHGRCASELPNRSMSEPNLATRDDRRTGGKLECFDG